MKKSVTRWHWQRTVQFPYRLHYTWSMRTKLSLTKSQFHLAKVEYKGGGWGRGGLNKLVTFVQSLVSQLSHVPDFWRHLPHMKPYPWFFLRHLAFFWFIKQTASSLCTKPTQHSTDRVNLPTGGYSWLNNLPLFEQNNLLGSMAHSSCLHLSPFQTPLRAVYPACLAPTFSFGWSHGHDPHWSCWAGVRFSWREQRCHQNYLQRQTHRGSHYFAAGDLVTLWLYQSGCYQW